ncbi:hypothetical protein BEWA_038150 [Theileria equi strain WA]|uniref:Uncharacterized protein n=1 Tax=Theileria equi strain WA TaxID=1537102 RepID=L1LF58_THEEQ|nr:hypothetical protein BEWA_038150 [Theileria equi strain WA]EKX73778.1 hypothetical protein BEWA_038150 [Theileria equi strain WA]|eukprot:XP_004833230.1 hypothetical protein BEWA_038150 [Theileria equi strain WA]
MSLLFPRNFLIAKNVLAEAGISPNVFQRWNFISTNHKNLSINRFSVYSEIISTVCDLNNRIRTLINSLYITFSRGRRSYGNHVSSKWRWYHRHGYWATRKKLLKFDTYRRHRYHEVRGPGKRAPSKWEDQSYYKPLKTAVKFW